MTLGRDILISIGVLSGILLAYLIVAALIGITHSKEVVCAAGYRAISVDGQRSKLPKTSSSLVVTDADFPTCSPMLSCPLEGQRWAVQPDGSSLTNSCDGVSACQCSAFQHCPSYVGTLFREFGFDQRISFFQVIDPDANPDSGIIQQVDPFDPPYALLPGPRDTCFLNPTTLPMLWPTLDFGQKCIRGVLAKLSTTSNTFVCAPDSYVHSGTFDVENYMRNYRK